MPRLIWTPSALDDVARLYRFLSFKDREIAYRAEKVIRENVGVLVHQPGSGRPVVLRCAIKEKLAIKRSGRLAA